MEKAFEQILVNGELIFDEDFMMNQMFVELSETIDPFKRYLEFMFEEKLSRAIGASQFPKIQVLGPYPPFFGIIVSNSERRHSQMSGIIKFSDTAIWRMTPTSKIQRQMAIHDTY